MALNKLSEIIQNKLKDDDLVLTKHKKAKYLSSGSLLLDKIVGDGVVVAGRITEIIGMEGSGKSTIAIQVCANALKQGMEVLYLDFEQTFDVNYGIALGANIDNKNFMIIQPKNLEQGVFTLREAEKLMPDNGKSLIVIDSIAAAKPKELLEKAAEQQRVGLHAQRIGELSGYLSSIWCGKKQAFVLLTNQFRSVPAIGSPFASKAVKATGVGFGMSSDTSLTTTGGQQLKYMTSIRIILDYAGKIEEGSWEAGDLVRNGSYIKAQTIKNKINPPYQSTKAAIIYGRGFVDDFAIIETLKDYEYITQGGAVYTFIDYDENEPGKGLSFKQKGKEDFYKKLKEPKYQKEMKRIYEYIISEDAGKLTEESDFDEDEELE